MYTNCLQCFSPLGSAKCPYCGFDNAAYTPEPHHLPPETVLHGRYLIGKALGEGGFGITYAGFDPVLKRKIAIKEYFPNGAVWRDPASSLDLTCYSGQNTRETFENGRQRCIREAQSLAKLDDIPAIVRILDFFPEHNTAYIIMEFVEGMTFSDYVRTLPQKLTLPQILDLLRPVTNALDDVHRRGFVHRDISPDNIMITRDGKAKLLDFGTVKSVVNGAASTENPVIKRGFSPSELYSTRGKIGSWTDVYALSATIYYLLTGSVPDEALDRLDEDTAPEKLRGLLDADKARALLHGMAVKPEERTQTAAALIAELSQESKPPVDIRKKLLIAAAAVLCAICVAIAVFKHTKPQPDAAEESVTAAQTTGTKAETTAAENDSAALTAPEDAEQTDITNIKRVPKSAGAEGSTHIAKPAKTLPAAENTGATDAAGIQTRQINVPAVTHNDSPYYAGARYSVWKPSGMRDVTDQAGELQWGDADILLADVPQDAALNQLHEYIMAAEVTYNGSKQISDETLNDIRQKNGFDADLLVALTQRDTLAPDAEVYRMSIGGRTWYCFDYPASDVARTESYCLVDHRVVRVVAVSIGHGADRTRELIYTNIGVN